MTDVAFSWKPLN